LVLGLFPLVTLLEHPFPQGQKLPLRTAIWYTSKRLPTFSDTLVFVRPTTLAGCPF